MSKKCAYFYFMKKEPEKIRQIVPQHIEYWQELNLKGYMTHSSARVCLLRRGLKSGSQNRRAIK
jgi:hypothetical protein